MKKRYLIPRRLRWLRNRPVMIHNMAKVGSTTLMMACIRAKRPQKRTHRLNPDSHVLVRHHRRNFENQVYEQGRRDWVVMQDFRALLGADGPNVWHTLARLTDLRFKVITVTRDPVGRNISHFFEIIEHRYLDFVERFESGEITMDRLIQEFFLEFDYDYCTQWFEREFHQVFGIDAFEMPFDPQVGHARWSSGRFEVLVLRLEDLAGCEHVVADFVELPGLKLERERAGSDASYKDIYRAFVDQVRFPEGYLDRVYGGQYVNKFYGPDEIARFRARWDR